MSNNVDNRVVKLSFDNDKFEEGVAKSMATLDRLEEKLQFKKSAKGLSALQVGIDGVNFDLLAKKIDTIEGRLSAFGIAGAKIVSNITDALFSGIAKLGEATLGQITSGGWERASNLENAKFTIEGLGLEWEEMLKAINYGVKDTAYGLDAAAMAAAQMAASGLDYKESMEGANDSMMHTTLRAISGVAAMTNRSYEDIARIFATAAGQGAVMGNTLEELGYRGMNAAAIMAEAFGMSEAEVREAASDRLISFEEFATVMDARFGQHAKDANKTFTGAFANMQAALKRFGAVFSSPILQNTNRFFIALTARIDEAKSAISDLKIGEEVYEGLESHFARMWSVLIDFSSALVDSANIDWFYTLAEAADNAILRIGDMFEAAYKVFGKVKEEAEGTYDLSVITQQELDIVKKVFAGAYGNGATRVKKLKEETDKYNKTIDEFNKKTAESIGIKYEETVLGKLDPEKIQEYVNILSKFNGDLDKAGIKLKELGEEEQTDPLQSMVDIFEKIKTNTELYKKGFLNVGTAVKEVFSDFISGLGFGMDIEYIVDAIYKLSSAFYNLSLAMRLSDEALSAIQNIGYAISNNITGLIGDVIYDLSWIFNFAKDIFTQWRDLGIIEGTLDNVASTINNVGIAIRNVWTILFTLGRAVLIAFFRVFDPEEYTYRLSNLSGSIADITEAMIPSEETMYKIADVLESVFRIIKNVKQAIRETIGTIFDIIASLAGFKRSVEEGEEEAEDGVSVLGVVFGTLLSVVTRVADIIAMIPETMSLLFDALEENEGVQHLTQAFQDLIDTIKESDDFAAIVAWFDGLATAAESAFTVENVAAMIGNVADSIANFIEKLPGWYKQIKDFVVNIRDVINGFMAPLLGKEIGKTEDEMTDFEKFANNAGTKIADIFKNLDWDTLIGAGFEVGGLALLYQLTGLLQAAKNIFWAFSTLEWTVARILWKFGSILNGIVLTLNSFALSTMMASLAISISTIAVAIYLICSLEESKLNKAMSIIEEIGGFIVVAIALMAIMDGVKYRWYGPKGITVKWIQLFQNIADILSIVFVIVAVAWAVTKIMDSVAMLLKVLSSYDDPQGMVTEGLLMLAAVAGAVIMLAIGVMVMCVKMSANLKLIRTATAMAAADASTQFTVIVSHASAMAMIIASIAAIIAAFGAAVWLMVDAIKILSTTEIKIGAVLGAFGILIALVLAAAAMMWVVTKLTPVAGVSMAPILAVAVAMAIMCGAVVAIIGAISLLAPALALIKQMNVTDEFYTTLAMVGVLIFAICISLAIMLAAASYTSKRVHTFAVGKEVEITGSIVGPLLAMALVLVAVAAVIGVISTSLILMKAAGVDLALFQSILQTVLGVVAIASVMMFVAVGIIKATVARDALNAAAMESVIRGFALMIVAFAGSFLLMAIAIKMIAKQMSKDKVAAEAATTVLKIFVGIIALLMAFVFLMSRSTRMLNVNGDFTMMLIGIAAAMVIMAVSLLIVAEACVVIGDAGEHIGIVVGFLIGFVAVMALFVLAAKYWPTALSTAATCFFMFGLAAVAVGGGVVLLAKGLEMLGPALEKFFAIVEQHGAAAIIFGILITVAIVALTVAMFKLSDTIGPVIKAIGEGIWTFVKAIASGIGTATQAIGNFFQKAGPMTTALIVLLVGSIISAMGDQGPRILKAIGRGIIMILDWLMESTGPIVNKLFDWLIELTSNLCDVIYDNVHSIVQLLMKAFSAIVFGILKAFGELMGGQNSVAGKFLMGWADEGMERAEKRLEGARATDKAMAEMRRNYKSWEDEVKKDDTAKKSTSVIDGVKNSILGLTGANNNLATSASKAKDAFEDYPLVAKQAMVEAGSAAFGADGSIFTKLTEGLDPNAISDIMKKGLGAFNSNGDFFMMATNGAKADTEGAKQQYADLPSQITEMLSSGSIDPTKFLESFGTNAGDYDISSMINSNGGLDLGALQVSGMELDFTSIMNGDGSFDLSAFEDIMGTGLWNVGEEGGINLGEGTADGMHEAASSIEASANSNVDVYLDTTKARFPDAYNIGHDIGDESSRGLRDSRQLFVDRANWALSGLTQVYDWFLGGADASNDFIGPANPTKGTLPYYNKAFSESLPNAITYNLEISSPSKVMRRLAKHIVSGFTLGLDSGLEDVTASSTNFSNAIIDSFGNPLDYVSKVASGELQYDPSIRPVLDTGSVTTGISAINTMLDSQNVTVSGFSGRLAADISGLDMTNNQMVTEIRALRSDMNEMTDQITNMKIVMNSGQLVGAISKDMNRVLGQDQVHRGRGM